MTTIEVLEHYRKQVQEQVHTLATLRLQGMDWNTVRGGTLDEILIMAYTQGADDALRHLHHLLEKDVPPRGNMQ